MSYLHTYLHVCIHIVYMNSFCDIFWLVCICSCRYKSIWRPQKGFGTLVAEVKLSVVVSHVGSCKLTNMGAGNWTVVLFKDNRNTSRLNHLFSAFESCVKGWCYGEPTRDDHSTTFLSQLKVLIPAGWDYTQGFGSPWNPQHLDQGDFKGEKCILLSSSAAEGEVCTSKQLNRS